MEYTRSNPPPNSPRCWGVAGEYRETDPECRGCVFNMSCKKVNQQPPPSYMTSYAPVPANAYPPPPPSSAGFRSLPVMQNSAPPPPPSSGYGPPPPPPRSGTQAMAPVYSPITPQPHPSQVQDPFPGIVGQYPGETVGERLAKNVVLRMFEALFTEMARFFHYWTWPSR